MNLGYFTFTLNIQTLIQDQTKSPKCQSFKTHKQVAVMKGGDLSPCIFYFSNTYFTYNYTYFQYIKIIKTSVHQSNGNISTVQLIHI